MLEAYDAHEAKMALGLLADDYEQTYLDPSFQRNGGIERGSGWTIAQSKFYIGSLLAGRTSNMVIRADVEECLRHAIRENDAESKEYFQKQKNAGHKYINIDGHNTSSSIYWFVQKEMKSIDPISKKEKGLNDFTPPQRKDVLYKEKILVATLFRISFRDMCHLFRHVNMSVKLNAQEFRQAMPTKLAAFVREVSNGGPNVPEII